MKMKSNVILNDDKVIKERLKYCVHITLGRFLNIQRTVSPLSHEKVAGQTTINSSTTWNMEQVRNYSILSYAQVIYTHFIALKCNFYVLHLSKGDDQSDSKRAVRHHQNRRSRQTGRLPSRRNPPRTAPRRGRTGAEDKGERGVTEQIHAPADKQKSRTGKGK